ncbi:MAG TPA: sxtJ [Gammaproteobacteria bacterium]|nr:sxtJ [Gammaproteobacteria bacterium]
MSIMTLEEQQMPELTSKELRNFGLIMGGMISLFFGLLLPWLWDRSFPVWPFAVAAVFVAVVLVYPKALAPVYKGWMKVGAVLGFINTRIILGLVFFAVIFPIGVLMRLKSDPMHRKFDRKATSYRKPSDTPSSESIRNPY